MGRSIAIPLEGEILELHPEKVIHWAAEHALLVADLHLGKAESFQSMGVAVPNGHDTEDLVRLESLAVEMGVKRVIVLGDLFHAQISGSLLKTFREWASSIQFKIDLVTGNHDRYAESDINKLPLTIHSELLKMGPFRLTHEPARGLRGFNICGHVHPQVRLASGNDSLRLPCFVIDYEQLILPSFGSFTGGFKMDFREGRTFYAVADGKLVEV